MTEAKAILSDRYVTEITPWGAEVSTCAPLLSPLQASLNEVVHQAFSHFIENLPTPEQSRQAAELNDEVRAGMENRCAVIVSEGFAKLSENDRRQVRLLVSTIENGDAYLADRCERDFGAVYQLMDGHWTTCRPEGEQVREIVLWTIDRFDLTLTKPALCPWDRASTAHVLSLTLASEQ
jgi:hypothetical protein